MYKKQERTAVPEMVGQFFYTCKIIYYIIKITLSI